MGDEARPTPPADLDAVVKEVVAEARARTEELSPEELAFLKEHALKKPLKVLDIWALGVGVVITGAYFGWNLGLKENNGPIAMLIASLVVCLLYLTWVLALSELSVALPFAGGPLAYGRRAVDPSLGFVMGWSMYLECQFATIATALATGGYIAFLFNPDAPNKEVETWSAIATVAVFFLLHTWGVKEQSLAMVVMTYGAILGLIFFCVVAATQFSWARLWQGPILTRPDGWTSVLKATPYALWWLVMIETVALAAEEAHEPHRTIPRGLVWAQLTLIVLVVLTLVFACGAVDDSMTLAVTPNPKDPENPLDNTRPLADVVYAVTRGRAPAVAYGFGAVALFGMIASYHGMVYGTSRQAFALGRAHYLPAFLGKVHGRRRTPTAALLMCSLITVGFIVANRWFSDAVSLAVLISTLTALIWYVLAMGCLFVLRRREAHIFTHYRTPLYRVLPVIVILLSLFAMFVYSVLNIQVIPLTALMYIGGLSYYWFRAHGRIQTAAPEELAARQSRAAQSESTP